MTPGPRIYNLFPTLAGPIDAWAEHLSRIAAMKFDWIYLNPFHETGYSGSLYAVKDHARLNPFFRGAATISDDALIRSFAQRAAAAGIGVMMDLVINHTARDAGLVASHPEWYRHDASGEIVSPSASDPAHSSDVTVWTDLAELDYRPRPERAAMRTYFSNVIRRYIALGVRGFRCDAAYKVPADVWSELIADARAASPGVLFAAENLGAPEEDVTALRAAGFDYLFNSAKWWDFKSNWLLDQYDRFRAIAPSIAFPESHDTPRLRAELTRRSRAEVEAQYRFRYLFAACFSQAVMMPMGYEFGFERRLDVVMTRPAHWETPLFDLSPFIASVNAMKAAVPAFNDEGPQQAIRDSRGQIVGLLRETRAGGDAALTLFNANETDPISIDARALAGMIAGRTFVEVTPGARRAAPRPMTLAPLELRVFAEPLDREAPAGELQAEGDAASGARPCVISAVTPQIDGGRYPVKRIAGDRVVVQADIFREGHDALTAVLRYRMRGSGAWNESRMRFVDNDRWAGAFTAHRIGVYEYTIEAWPDPFATWRHDVGIKRDAGQSLALELQEGRKLVEAAAARGTHADRDAAALLAALDAAASDDAALGLLLSGVAEYVMDLVPDRSRATRYAPVLELRADRRAAAVGAWYEFFPRSQSRTPGKHGTFADAQAALPRVRELGFDVVYLPPIHPIGESFRKGRNNSLEAAPDDPGSPWAIGNAAGGHRSVDPKLGTLDDFDRFVAAAGSAGLEVALDYALQCSPDHPYVREHPEWFTFRPDGSIKYAENPPKKYQDIVNFNWYGAHAAALWNELRDIVEFWIGHGVRIFRVDNPHTKPFAFWEWMIADVQSRHPEVLFLAEAFTRPKVMQHLAKAGFSQSYTYFTWRNTKAELTEYATELAASPMADYYRPNFFVNTPDILPPFLQTGGRPAFLIRLYLAATLSSLYGVYSGFEIGENAALPGREEYADSEKYEIKSRDWDAPGNINADIRRVNRIRREHRALHDWRNIRFLESEHDSVLFFMKRAGNETLLIAVNVDPRYGADARLHLPFSDLDVRPGGGLAGENLITGQRGIWRDAVMPVWLDPWEHPAAIFLVERIG